MKKVFEKIRWFTTTVSTILIQGKSGREGNAAGRSFLTASAGAPLVPVNCGAIPKTSGERALFATRRRFTGAIPDGSDGRAGQGGTTPG
jgi:DNA-binding NtrC family response regulator